MAILDWEYCSGKAPGSYARLFHREAQAGEKSLTFHSSPYYQIVWIQAGGGVYNVMGREYPFQAGDLFLFTQRETHYVRAVQETPTLRMESLLFSRQFLCPESDFGLYSEYLRIYTDRSPEYSNRISGGDPRTAAYFDTVRALYEDARLPAETAACRVRARLLFLLTQLALDHGELIAAESDGEAALSPCVLSAVRYIDAHFREELTLDDLAGQAGLARSYFSAAFKRAQGMTPWDYLTSKRIDCAIALMVKEGKSVTAAATQSGFNSTVNFNRAFRKYTGKTPTEYLRTLRVK